MNWLHWTLLILLIIFLVLLPLRPRFAWTYGRYTVLILVGLVMILPFIWLGAAAFKDKDVLNTYLFLPPPNHVVSDRIVTLNNDEVLRGAIETIPGATDEEPDTVKITTHEERRLEDGTTERVSRTVPADAVVSMRSLINVDNYRELLSAKETVQGPVSFWRYVFNSLFLASTATTVALLFSSMGGYALAKYKFLGSRALIAFMLASMTIPGIVLLAPNFDIIYRLGWMDTYWALLVPGAVSVFGIFLFRQAIVGVPDDIIEAGRIDGCGEFRIYLTLVMPLIRPMIGAFCLITFLGTWNSFIGPNIFLQSQRLLPLPVVLNQYIGQYSQQYGVFLAGTLLAILPPAILFFALQREFISGLTSGAVKQ